MTQPPDFEARMGTLNRDVATLSVKVDANRRAINALGEQTRERFDSVDRRFDALERKVDNGFAEMRGTFAEMRHSFAEMRARLDGTAAGLDRIAKLINLAIERRDPS